MSKLTESVTGLASGIRYLEKSSIMFGFTGILYSYSDGRIRQLLKTRLRGPGMTIFYAEFHDDRIVIHDIYRYMHTTKRVFKELHNDLAYLRIDTDHNTKSR